jgi:hypothetical protein
MGDPATGLEYGNLDPGGGYGQPRPPGIRQNEGSELAFGLQQLLGHAAEVLHGFDRLVETRLFGRIQRD